ncbi:hypothetical protein NDN08_007356 [Rhodosorus marinus]|uniref:Methionine aminopeptidase n=1 Tax=Rhodosorus marinus TaxID=101924 RepID=A0AAV8UJR8_9RHOD|nr:hypothetical protein NDN08_007356 [Rhodosorus marinus]
MTHVTGGQRYRGGMNILKMREKGMKLGFLVTSGGAWGGKGLEGNVQQRRLCWTSMAGKGFGMRPRFKYTVKSEADIEAMRVSGRLAREVLDIAGRMVKPGVSTDEIDAAVHEESLKRNCYPSPLNYRGFPKSCCTSINEIICHGIPDTTILKDGDIVNIDITVYHNGYHGDCSETVLVGNVDDEGKKLVRVTYECLMKAMEICKPGVPYSEIGNTIQKHADDSELRVVTDFIGHGIGKAFHTTPNVLHFANNQNNGIMKEGHVFTIEPMINEGTIRNVIWPDQWTAATKDGKRSAQFEHTLLLTKNGVEPLTGRLPDSNPLRFME